MNPQATKERRSPSTETPSRRAGLAGRAKDRVMRVAEQAGHAVTRASEKAGHAVTSASEKAGRASEKPASVAAEPAKTAAEPARTAAESANTAAEAAKIGAEPPKHPMTTMTNAAGGVANETSQLKGGVPALEEIVRRAADDIERTASEMEGELVKELLGGVARTARRKPAIVAGAVLAAGLVGRWYLKRLARS